MKTIINKGQEPSKPPYPFLATFNGVQPGKIVIAMIMKPGNHGNIEYGVVVHSTDNVFPVGWHGTCSNYVVFNGAITLSNN